MTEDQKMSVLSANLSAAFRSLPDCGHEPPGCLPDPGATSSDWLADYECTLQDRVDEQAKSTAKVTPHGDFSVDDIEATLIPQPSGRVRVLVSLHVGMTIDADDVKNMDLSEVSCALAHLWSGV